MTPMSAEGCILHARVARLDDHGLGLLDDAAVAWSNGTLCYVGPSAEAPAAAQRWDAAGRLLTPGLIDCHTHLVFAGDRAGEFEQRLQGVSYQDIAAAGGGILSSVRATRGASAERLLAESLPRARALLADGVTTLEIKSGYGLEPDSEYRMLEVARRIGVELGISVRTSLLAAHALPPEYRDRRADYLELICQTMIPHCARHGLADAVDAYCEGIGFSPQETRQLFAAARRHGLPVKLHADQLSNLGGAALVAEFAGLSADHIEYTDADGIAALARAGSVAVLLPAAFYALRETQLPPIEGLRAAAVPMAVASDLNPGTSPIQSLRLAMNMACTLFRLTPLEALRGTTVHAAHALGLSDRGQLFVGQRADLVLWQASHPAELSYWIGGLPPCLVVAGGRPLIDHS